MGDDAERFRRRARECRELAERAHGGEWRDRLIEIADELEAEADKADADEEAARREQD
jgi:hypothetical protein